MGDYEHGWRAVTDIQKSRVWSLGAPAPLQRQKKRKRKKIVTKIEFFFKIGSRVTMTNYDCFSSSDDDEPMISSPDCSDAEGAKNDNGKNKNKNDDDAGVFKFHANKFQKRKLSLSSSSSTASTSPPTSSRTRRGKKKKRRLTSSPKGKLSALELKRRKQLNKLQIRLKKCNNDTDSDSDSEDESGLASGGGRNGNDQLKFSISADNQGEDEQEEDDDPGVYRGPDEEEATPPESPARTVTNPDVVDLCDDSPPIRRRSARPRSTRLASVSARASAPAPAPAPVRTRRSSTRLSSSAPQETAQQQNPQLCNVRITRSMAAARKVSESSHASTIHSEDNDNEETDCEKDDDDDDSSSYGVERHTHKEHKRKRKNVDNRNCNRNKTNENPSRSRSSPNDAIELLDSSDDEEDSGPSPPPRQVMRLKSDPDNDNSGESNSESVARRKTIKQGISSKSNNCNDKCTRKFNNIKDAIDFLDSSDDEDTGVSSSKLRLSELKGASAEVLEVIQRSRAAANNLRKAQEYEAEDVQVAVPSPDVSIIDTTFATTTQYEPTDFSGLAQQQHKKEKNLGKKIRLTCRTQIEFNGKKRKPVERLLNFRENENLQVLRDELLRSMSPPLPPTSNTIMLFDGVSLEMNRTPASYEIENEDLIDVSVKATVIPPQFSSPNITTTKKKRGRDITLTLRHKGGTNRKPSFTETELRLGQQDTFQILLEKYQKQQEQPSRWQRLTRTTRLTKISFQFDGEILDMNKTPASYDMESGDLIDVFHLPNLK